MTASEKRTAVVSLLRTRIKKNQYTQGAKRNQVFQEPTGWGDCSSTVRVAYKRALNIDIGTNTAAQIVSKAGLDVDVSDGTACPNTKNLKPGDCLYFKGTDASRPFSVGHVEMYIGNNQLVGHGSGVGPTVKQLKAYCKNRQENNRAYIKTRRFIADDEPFIAPPNPQEHPPVHPRGTIVVTGETVNLREAPSADSPSVATVRQGETLRPVNATGWRAVLYEGKVVWISEKYSKAIDQ